MGDLPIVAGKFRFERIVAEGGMGIVVAATHLQLDRRVALKFVRPHPAGEAVRDSLVGEARTAARLQSEHVARVLDVGQAEDGAPYIVMEYLEGRSLAEVLRAQGQLGVAEAADYAIQACEGLAEAHSFGIVHRDIKPSNLFLAERGPYGRAIKILDFGISNMAIRREQDDTPQEIVGSPPYMSPEQFQADREVDHRADLWSLGVTLYELLTGTTPFSRSLALPELVKAIRSECPLPISHFRSDVPKELAAIVNRCLLKDPNDRFQSAAELASALLKFAPESARTPVQHASSMPPAFGPDVAKERRTDHEEICEFREARHEGFTASAQPSPSHSVVKHRQESRLTIDPIWSLADQHREHRPSQSWVKGALMAAVLATVALGYQLENRHPGHILEVARIHSHSAGGVR